MIIEKEKALETKFNLRKMENYLKRHKNQTAIIKSKFNLVENIYVDKIMLR